MNQYVPAVPLLLALLLVGCNAPSPASRQESPPAPEEPALTVTAEDLGRTATTTFTYYLEGEETQLPASLCIGEGWSVYIPDEGWTRSQDTVDEMPAACWTSDVNEDVTFRILGLGQMTLQQAQSWVTGQFPDYTFIEDKRGGLGGMNDDQHCADVRLISSDNGMYAILYCYPLEASEGFGVTLSVIGDNFQTYTT